jgi:hypothetical protein
LRDPLGWRKEEIVKRKRERAKGKEGRGKREEGRGKREGFATRDEFQITKKEEFNSGCFFFLRIDHPVCKFETFDPCKVLDVICNEL